MSLKYRDSNGIMRDLAGISPGGNLETGAVATRSGEITVASLPAGNCIFEDVTFTEPLPDGDYEVILYMKVGSRDGEMGDTFAIPNYLKAATGFRVWFYNSGSVALANLVYTYKAFKLYEVADAEALYSDVTDIKSYIPSNASSTNKLSTANDLRTETRSLDRRIDDLEDVFPVDASLSNQLVTESDLSSVEIDKVEDINDVELTSIQDGQTLIWDATNSKWVNGQGGKVYSAGDGINISNTDEISAKVDDTSITTDSNDALKVADTYKTTFVGTKAEWDALSTTDKKKYKVANITDDVIGGEVADAVTDGDARPVTSNAVFDHCVDNLFATTEVKTNKIWYNGKPVYRKLWTGLDFGNTKDAWTTISGISSSELSNIEDIVGFIARRTSDNMVDNALLIRTSSDNTSLMYYSLLGTLHLVTLVLEYTKTT